MEVILMINITTIEILNCEVIFIYRGFILKSINKIITHVLQHLLQE